MAKFGYTFVSDKGFIAFLRDLDEGEWKGVSIAGHDAPDQMAAGALLAAPRPVVWKLRATWAIGALRGVVGGASAEVLAGLDDDWDSVQRKTHHLLGAALEDGHQGTREAAGRLRSVLLAGNGIAQTNLGYDDEVDFGRQQVELAGKGGLADDAKKVGITAILKKIEATTEALAVGLGRGPGQKRSAPRSIQMREALTACSSSFNAIHEEMAWMIEHTPPGPTRTQLEHLRAPFEALLARVPPPAAATKAEAEAGSEAAVVTGGAATKPVAAAKAVAAEAVAPG